MTPFLVDFDDRDDEDAPKATQPSKPNAHNINNATTISPTVICPIIISITNTMIIIIVD